MILRSRKQGFVFLVWIMTPHIPRPWQCHPYLQGGNYVAEELLRRKKAESRFYDFGFIIVDYRPVLSILPLLSALRVLSVFSVLSTQFCTSLANFAQYCWKCWDRRRGDKKYFFSFSRRLLGRSLQPQHCVSWEGAACGLIAWWL